MTDTQTEAEQIRLARFAELKSLSQFKMMDKVEITGGFYEWQKGIIFAERDFVRDPSQDVNSTYQEWVCISYEVVIQDEEEKTIDRREVESRYLKDI